MCRYTALIAQHPYCIQPQPGKAVNSEAFASQRSEPLSSDDDPAIHTLWNMVRPSYGRGNRRSKRSEEDRGSDSWAAPQKKMERLPSEADLSRHEAQSVYWEQLMYYTKVARSLASLVSIVLYSTHFSSMSHLILSCATLTPLASLKTLIVTVF